MPRSRRARGQGGLSLVEVLVAVMMVSLLVVGLASGMLTMLGASEASSSRQQRDAAVTSFTESLKAIGYRPCAAGVTPTANDYQTAYQAWPGAWVPAVDAGVSQTVITRVEFWNPTAGTAPKVGAFQSTCPAADGGAQRLSISVNVRGATATGNVVIRS